MANLEQIKFMREMVTILDEITKHYMPSNKCINVKPDNDFFEESCNYIALFHEISTLKETLRNCTKYSEIIINKKD